MVARWDFLLFAATLLGGSMMIENSHRLDTGAPDEALGAAAATACLDPQAAARANLRREFGNEEGFSTSGADDDAAQAPLGCGSE